MSIQDGSLLWAVVSSISSVCRSKAVVCRVLASLWYSLRPRREQLQIHRLLIVYATCCTPLVSSGCAYMNRPAPSRHHSQGTMTISCICSWGTGILRTLVSNYVISALLLPINLIILACAKVSLEINYSLYITLFMLGNSVKSLHPRNVGLPKFMKQVCEAAREGRFGFVKKGDREEILMCFGCFTSF
jgi:hypothetical protein